MLDTNCDPHVDEFNLWVKLFDPLNLPKTPYTSKTIINKQVSQTYLVSNHIILIIR